MGQAKTGEVKRARRHGRPGMAARLGVQPRAVRERAIKPGEVGGLLAARPGWLIAEQEQVRARIGRERDASRQAARYRAGQLLRRAVGG
jgi:hypothetical protein